MKLKITLIIFCTIVINSAIAKKNTFIQIQANKTLALLAFVETANGSQSVSLSFKNFIDKKLGNSDAFQKLIKRYHALKLEFKYELEGYPNSRHAYKNTKDFIWIAASNASDLDDLSERILGYLPYETHLELIEVLRQIEPYYDELVWKKTKKQSKRIVKQLSAYSNKIEALFLQISHFLGSSWSKQTPFKVMLYPIPLKQGHTTAIPKGNALIVGFLSENKHDYKNRLGIIVHEMVHILYAAQPVRLQNNIDKWFKQSQSAYAKLAYNFINEGLATAIGNGWAYQQINGKIDSEEWYNNPHINGFAHAIFPAVSNQLKNNRIINQEFIQNSITLFKNTFPKAIDETQILFNEIYLFANIQDKEKPQLQKPLFKHFNIRSMWLYTPINDPESLESMQVKRTTKLFIITNNNQTNLNFLRKQFTTIPEKLDTTSNFIYSLKHQDSKSTIVIINIQSLDKLEAAIKQLAQDKYLKLGLQTTQ